MPFSVATPPRENGFQNRPQAFLKPENINILPLNMRKANAARILNRLATPAAAGPA